MSAPFIALVTVFLRGRALTNVPFRAEGGGKARSRTCGYARTESDGTRGKPKRRVDVDAKADTSGERAPAGLLAQATRLFGFSAL